MAVDDPLATLADIQEPAIDALWFERPLVWLALLLLLVLVVYAVLKRYQQFQQQAPRREALALLQRLPAQCTASELTEILKRYLKARQLPVTLLSATPSELQRFLEHNSRGSAEDIRWADLMTLHYQRDVDAAQLQSYRQSLARWLSHHPWVLTLP